MTGPLSLSEIGITARIGLSCVGRGAEAHQAAMAAGRSGLTRCDYPDAALPCYIGRVAGVEDIRLPGPLTAWTNRASQLAVMALEESALAERTARARARWGATRVGLVIGTSTSGVERLEQVYRARPDPCAPEQALPADYSLRHHNDHHAVTAFLGEWLGLEGPGFTVSTACSSSAKAVIDAAQLIQAGICDAVLAGGIDSLCLTSLFGFDALELVSRAPSAPFDAARDGLSIGEGAGFLLLERGGEGARLRGYGESSDAVNMSTPPEDGAGARAAMQTGLAMAGLSADEIGFVKLHGTATPSNDAAEGRAVAAIFPDSVPAVSLKGMIGHTLGAAGALEAVMALDAMEAGLIPGTVGMTTPDPDIPLCAAAAPVPAGAPRHVIANAFGFGGSNSSLILSHG